MCGFWISPERVDARETAGKEKRGLGGTHAKSRDVVEGWGRGGGAPRRSPRPTHLPRPACACGSGWPERPTIPHESAEVETRTGHKPRGFEGLFFTSGCLKLSTWFARACISVAPRGGSNTAQMDSCDAKQRQQRQRHQRNKKQQQRRAPAPCQSAGGCQ